MSDMPSKIWVCPDWPYAINSDLGLDHHEQYINQKQFIEWLEGEKKETFFDMDNTKTLLRNKTIDDVIEKLKG